MGWEYARPDTLMGWFESWGSCYKFSRALGCCWLPLVFYPGSNTWSSGHMLQIISHTNTTRGIMISLTHVVRSTYVWSLNSINGFRVFVPKMFRTRFIRVRKSSDYMWWLKVLTEWTIQSVPPWRIEWHTGVKQLCRQHQTLHWHCMDCTVEKYLHHYLRFISSTFARIPQYLFLVWNENLYLVIIALCQEGSYNAKHQMKTAISQPRQYYISFRK